jgi:hypothetical protein
MPGPVRAGDELSWVGFARVGVLREERAIHMRFLATKREGGALH